MKTSTRSFYEAAVHKAVTQVIAGLDRALDLHALARNAALSPFHFHRIFRGMVGETPLELHRRLRLERAAWQLRNGDESVTSIAFAAGYETHESFTRAFRLHYNCSPSEFRLATPAAAASCVRVQSELAAKCGIHFPVDDAPTPFILTGERMEIMNVKIKDMPEMRVATVEHVGPYNQISQAFAKLGQIAAQSQLFGPETAMVGIFHDDPETTPASELRSEAALVVSPRVDLPDEVGERRLPAGRYATTTHVGPYENLGDTWSRLMGEWLPRSGHRMSDGVSYEIYRNTPEDTPKEKLVTELYIPIE